MNRYGLKIKFFSFLESLLGKDRVLDFYKELCIRRYVKSQCIFIHIPKAGGTSIAEATIGKRAGHFTAKEIKDRMGEQCYESLFSFSVVRNPYKRILSSYNFIKNGGGSKGAVRNEDYFERNEFDSFDSFVKKWLTDQDLEKTNILFRPQYTFVIDSKDNLIVDFVGKIEELSLCEEEISKELNRNIVIGKSDITERKAEESISEETKEIVYDLYDKDFKLFKYKK